MADPRAKGWATGAIVILAAVAVGGGLAISGGPMQGRKESRDRLRMSDLSAIESQAACRAQNEGQLTTDLGPTPPCPTELRLADPFTDTPYRIEQIDSQNLRLCAPFETDEYLRRMGYSEPAPAENVDAQPGCIVARVIYADGTAGPAKPVPTEPKPGGQVPAPATREPEAEGAPPAQP